MFSMLQDQSRLTRFLQTRIFHYDGRMMKGEQILYAEITKYPGNKCEFINPVGAIRLAFQPGGSFGAQYHLVRLEPLCGGPNCVIDVRQGLSCADVGSALYDPKKVVGNPFHDARYRSYEGVAKGEFGLYTGKTYEDYVGHAIVVNSMGNAPIGCGILQPWYPPINNENNNATNNGVEADINIEADRSEKNVETDKVDINIEADLNKRHVEVAPPQADKMVGMDSNSIDADPPGEMEEGSPHAVADESDIDATPFDEPEQKPAN